MSVRDFYRLVLTFYRGGIMECLVSPDSVGEKKPTRFDYDC